MLFTWKWLKKYTEKNSFISSSVKQGNFRVTTLQIFALGSDVLY